MLHTISIYPDCMYNHDRMTDMLAGDNGGHNNICQRDLPGCQGAQPRDRVHIQQITIEMLIMIVLIIIVIRDDLYIERVCLSVCDKTLKTYYVMINIISSYHDVIPLIKTIL